MCIFDNMEWLGSMQENTIVSIYRELLVHMYAIDAQCSVEIIYFKNKLPTGVLWCITGNIMGIFV